MPDREKVIKGLEHCISEGDCRGCPYFKVILDSKIICPCREDALALLKEQDELLHKKQNDINRLCNEISEWKHKFHDTLKQEPVCVKESKINKCACGNIVNRYYHPKFCGCCGKELMWY